MPDQEQLVKATFNAPAKPHRSPDYKIYYVNQSRLRLSQADLQIYFGLLTDDPAVLGAFTNEEMLSIIMAPQHAKIFAQGFMNAVNAYEAAFGEIKLAPDATKGIEALKSQLLSAIATAPKP